LCYHQASLCLFGFHIILKKSTDFFRMMGFNAFHSAQAIIDDIETAHMIRKSQLPEDNNSLCPGYFVTFALSDF